MQVKKFLSTNIRPSLIPKFVIINVIFVFILLGIFLLHTVTDKPAQNETPKNPPTINSKIQTPYSTLEDFTKFPTFKEHQINKIFKETPAQLALSSHPKAITYKGALEAGIKNCPNFAGHYCIITWGCGSPCQQIAVVDSQTGTIYFAPFLSSIGSEFQLSSSLLIVNPPKIRLAYINNSTDGTLAPWQDFPSYYYKWGNNEFVYLDSNDPNFAK